MTKCFMFRFPNKWYLNRIFGFSLDKLASWKLELHPIINVKSLLFIDVHVVCCALRVFFFALLQMRVFRNSSIRREFAFSIWIDYWSPFDRWIVMASVWCVQGTGTLICTSWRCLIDCHWQRTHTHSHGIPLRKIIIRNGKWWYRGWVPFKLRRCDGGDCGTVCYLLLLMKVCLLMIDLTKLMHLIHTKNDNLSTFPTTLVLLLAKQILIRFR